MNLTAACAFGLESLVKRELISLGFHPKVEQPGRISFSGNRDAIAKTNVWLRTADRVLIQACKFPAPDFDALFETVKAFDWAELLPANARFPVTGRSRLSQLTSVPAVQRTVKRAIVDSLKRQHSTSTLGESGPEYKIDVALLNDVATLTIDTTGPSLHKRGYRKLTGLAPIKETLAAAMVDLSVWNPKRTLVDPFCGTGTIPIEAAMIGMNIAPGLQRDFTFQSWNAMAQQAVDDAKQQARDAMIKDADLQIIGTDHDAQPLEMARYHARQAGVASQIHFQEKPFDQFRSKREFGCMVTNPPYGERLEDTKKLLPLYQSIPQVFQRVPTWSLFLITNMPKLEAIVQKSATRRRKLFNGRIECTYYQFLGPRPDKRADRNTETNLIANPKGTTGHDLEINPENKQVNAESPVNADAVFSGLQEKDHQQAELFRSRLVKRARHLRRWPTRRGITCFRLYERDIPEIPLVVDRYGNAIHMTRYDRPHDRDLARDAAWLDLMKKTVSSSLDIPIQRVHLKTRTEATQQYRKVDAKQKFQTVNERDLKFLVNLTDYVDTGLFLDHRNLRQMVREQSNGKDVLNLFAYTGSFSVYAASGGAQTTTTVDLSRNYLDWAKRNLELNELSGRHHRFVSQDSIEYLKETAQKARTDTAHQFDLAVVDPPTYSNSKRTVQDWDVQKRHVELLQLVQRVMRPGGVVYFSTNFRRFKLDKVALSDFEIREISNQTVPEDFRNKRIHRCWWLRARGAGS